MTSNELQGRINQLLSLATCHSLLVTAFDIFCNAIGGRFVLGTEEVPTAISPPRNAKDAPGK